MKDGNLTILYTNILYTKETRSFLHSALCLQSNRAAAEQTAKEQSAGHVTRDSLLRDSSPGAGRLGVIIHARRMHMSPRRR